MRDILHGWTRDFHTPSITLVGRVKEKCSLTLRLVRKAKNEYYCKMVEEANTQNIWTYRKWTTGTRTYTVLTIERDNQPLAVSHANKCDTLRAHLFPEPPPLTDEPPLDLNPRAEDMPHFIVTRREVRHAIFMAAQLNAVSEKTLLLGCKSSLCHREKWGKTQCSAGFGSGLVAAQQWCV